VAAGRGADGDEPAVLRQPPDDWVAASTTSAEETLGDRQSAVFFPTRAWAAASIVSVRSTADSAMKVAPRPIERLEHHVDPQPSSSARHGDVACRAPAAVEQITTGIGVAAA